jgi:hypothetical protein
MMGTSCWKKSAVAPRVTVSSKPANGNDDLKTLSEMKAYLALRKSTHDQLWFDCSAAFEPRPACYAAYQSSKHLPSNLKAELREDEITTLNFSPDGEMIPTWAANVK